MPCIVNDQNCIARRWIVYLKYFLSQITYGHVLSAYRCTDRLLAKISDGRISVRSKYCDTKKMVLDGT